MMGLNILWVTKNYEKYLIWGIASYYPLVDLCGNFFLYLYFMESGVCIFKQPLSLNVCVCMISIIFISYCCMWFSKLGEKTRLFFSYYYNYFVFDLILDFAYKFVCEWWENRQGHQLLNYKEDVDISLIGNISDALLFYYNLSSTEMQKSVFHLHLNLVLFLRKVHYVETKP